VDVAASKGYLHERLQRPRRFRNGRTVHSRWYFLFFFVWLSQENPLLTSNWKKKKIETGKSIVTVSEDNSLKLWDPKTGACVWSISSECGF
jgi:WD40 repeat protein